MKKTKTKRLVTEDEMLPEYDFTGKVGVRGKYYQAYQQGHTVKIHHADGSVTVQQFKLAEGAVMLEPDVREYFPNSAAVNATLRSLIKLVPAKRRTKEVRKTRAKA